MNRGFFIISALLCAYIQPLTALADDAYHISTSQSTLNIHADLKNIAPGEKLCLPAFGQRHGEILRNVRVTSQPKPDKNITPDAAGCFHGITADALTIDYELEITPLTPDHFWLASKLSANNQNGMITIPGESLFVERGADNTENRRVKTEIHFSNAGWIVSTLPNTHTSNEIVIRNMPGGQLLTGTPEPPKSQSFTALDQFELTRSYWALGQFKHREFSSGDTHWQFAVSQDWYSNESVLEREITGILEYYKRLLPERTPNHIAVFIFTAPFDADYHQGIARPNGILLQIGAQSAQESGTRRLLIAHELFHLYNGEGLRFDIAQREETAWFREGMTQYMAFRALLSLGLISSSQFYHWLATSIQKQNSSHYDSYHHGFFVSLAIEQQWLLFQTGYTLEKFWQFISSAPAWNQLQTNATLERLLTEYSAFDFEPFFSHYVARKSKLPIENLLKLSGLCLYTNKQPWYFIGLEYDFNPKTSQLFVSRIEPRSPAALGGLQKGDIIVPENNINWYDDTDKTLTVLRKDKKLLLRIPVTTKERNGILVDQCH